ncbi:hypothetical protein L873DRAFT_404207 [Choiromyces venosus 120613-1]|uniref:Uncharacterized protein n=1 Tax=Choiromyces venosus 120613-1 TaxID=1336337 RepID=A0A3N4IWP5_9PEZI|nr:hypothetical protein L873DRAFT_404207 [Choiromyces venosus 120613-1]
MLHCLMFTCKNKAFSTVKIISIKWLPAIKKPLRASRKLLLSCSGFSIFLECWMEPILKRREHTNTGACFGFLTLYVVGVLGVKDPSLTRIENIDDPRSPLTTGIEPHYRVNNLGETKAIEPADGNEDRRLATV